MCEARERVGEAAPRAPETIMLSLPAEAVRSGAPVPIGQLVVTVDPGSVSLSGAMVAGASENDLRSAEAHTLELQVGHVPPVERRALVVVDVPVVRVVGLALAEALGAAFHMEVNIFEVRLRLAHRGRFEREQNLARLTRRQSQRQNRRPPHRQTPQSYRCWAAAWAWAIRAVVDGL